MERLYSSLAGTKLLRRHSWEGKFGSATCPVCDQRDYLFFTEEGGEFRYGCRERCDKLEILANLGLDGYDMLDGKTPKFLNRGKLKARSDA